MFKPFLFWSSFCLAILTTAQTPRTVKSVAFEDLREGQKQVAFNTRVKLSKTKTKCALDCINYRDCVAFNFCGDTDCELIKQDVDSSAVQRIGNFVEDESCTYFRMSKNSTTVFQQEGTTVSNSVSIDVVTVTSDEQQVIDGDSGSASSQWTWQGLLKKWG